MTHPLHPLPPSSSSSSSSSSVSWSDNPHVQLQPNPRRRLFSAAALGAVAGVAAGTWPLTAAAQPADKGDFKNGRDYLTLQRPAPTQAKPGITEVVEFFWYNCPHCNEFEPMLEGWSRRLPSTAVLRRVPVAFRPDFEAQQRLYYTLDAMGQVDKLHKKVFATIHGSKQPLNTPEQITAWAENQGLNKATFAAAFNSFSVSSEVRKAVQLQQAYQLDGVPSLGIAGRYYTSAEQAQTLPRSLQVADYLIDQLRKST